MKSIFWFLVLLGTSALAQQPAFRVHLLSLYHIQQVTIVPTGETSLYWDVQGTRQALRGALTIASETELVRIGGRTSRKVTVQGSFNLTADSTRPIHLDVPLELTARHGKLRLVGVFPMEDYVAAVLQGETAGDMPPETLKAMALAVRSYATRFRQRHKEEGFDFCDTTHCQYLRTDITSAIRSATKATEDELLWIRGRPLAAYYHKDCGGRTEDVAVVWPDQRSPSLVSHADPYCGRVSKAWHSELSRSDIERALSAADFKVPASWDRITVFDRTLSGRARTLQFNVGNSQQHATMSASSFRFALGRSLGWNTLKSDWYDVSSYGDHFIFNGRGTGHGVGLCQTGGAEMAREGKGYREILAFYYPGAVIGKSAQAIPWTIAHDDAFDIRTVNATDAPPVARAARAAFDWAKQRSGFVMTTPFTIDVYPTVAMFRDATGEPGWVAASTRGDHVRIQPPGVLKERIQLLLRHEFLHLLIECNAKPGTPTWFREGLVLLLSDEEEKTAGPAMTPSQIDDVIQSRRNQAQMKQAYAAAAAMVRCLEHKYGRQQLMTWLRSGLPADLSTVRSDKVTQ